MKHLIVGAGATFAEALALGNPVEKCPPLISDFARKMWDNYTPHPYLEEYLRRIGYPDFDPRDPRILFFKLEEQGVTNVEKFIEFVWNNRDATFPVSKTPPAGYISGLRIGMQSPSHDSERERSATFWDDLQYHGIGNALTFYLIQCFHENEVGLRNFELTKSVATKYGSGDLVLNLNYDTVFEIALNQLARPFVYAPNQPKQDELIVCKPHGSINLVTDDTGFAFGQPDWWGIPEPQGYRSFSGFVPPRLNKRYDQHPIAKMILDSARNRHPRHIAMWGVGLTDSDADLIDLYSAWVRRAESVDIINPSFEVAEKARKIFGRPVHHFADVAHWNADAPS
ncbi:hypothetical protein [Bradyrhizobium sp. RT4b]|uniref:hypothetical protein n=1 Tax=unclassified Bradyrhizobium TaxID=2631580 RepID=UPI0033960002